MKTSRYIQNLYCCRPRRGQPDVLGPPAESVFRPFTRQKMSYHRHLGRKLDDSLPDFTAFVVKGCRKYRKRSKNRDSSCG
ncbi:hypothetical protein A8H26_01720 [Pluralibacter gergoviae]|nr:hypothetical protein A8H26_01720 [Pluralibacter gergoviae]